MALMCETSLYVNTNVFHTANKSI